MAELESNSIDAIITDPPYELGFMGKKWDKTGIAYDIDMWAECLRVLKPGGYLLSFSSGRTYHRMTCAIEDAGFDIRDQIMWVYGSGFPKSLDISKAIDKIEGHWRGRAGEVVSDNGAMSGGNYERTPKGEPITDSAKQWQGWGTALKPAHEPICVARKPLSEETVASNVLKHGTGALNIDGCRNIDRYPANLIHDGLDESWSRYFYCAKTSKKDRNEGLEDMELKANIHGSGNGQGGLSMSDSVHPNQNHHPTVKPTELMRHLCRLVTPPNGLILDPFAGSGSTGKAAALEGFQFVGFELEPEYLSIAEARIAASKLCANL